MLIGRSTLFLLFLSALTSTAQTTISGKFIGLEGIANDSTIVVLKDGTGDTTFASTVASKNGSYHLTTNQSGPLLAVFSSPRYQPVQAALILDAPTSIVINPVLKHSLLKHQHSRLGFPDSMSTVARFAQVQWTSTLRYMGYAEARAAFVAQGGDDDQFTMDWKDETAAVVKRLAVEKEPLLRQELIIQYYELIALKSRYTSVDSIRLWIKEVPPTSPAWTYHGGLVLGLSNPDTPDGFDYVDELITSHPSIFLRSILLYYRAEMALSARDMKGFDSLYVELTTRYPNTKSAKEVHSLAPERASPEASLPLIVLMEQDPWLFVIGSDSPTLAVYENGLVIYRCNEADKPVRYCSALLNSAELSALVQPMLHNPQFDSTAARTVVAHVTDQPTNVIYYSDGRTLHSKSVYGAIRSDTSARAKTPRAFLDAFDRLIAFHVPNSTPWMPSRIEIMIQEFAGTEEPAEWPHEWPQLESPGTINRGAITSLYLDAKLYDGYMRFVSGLKEGQSIRIGGRTWHSSVRFPFPGEQYWMR